jgi:hypothetical protein
VETKKKSWPSIRKVESLISQKIKQLFDLKISEETQNG